MTEDLEFSLGGDYDCDTCGWSYNEIVLELWDKENDVWQLYMRVGCYGGESVLSLEADWDVRVKEILKSAKGYPEFTKDAEKQLKKKIAVIKGKNDE